jgi:hypothetical protein
MSVYVLITVLLQFNNFTYIAVLDGKGLKPAGICLIEKCEPFQAFASAHISCGNKHHNYFISKNAEKGWPNPLLPGQFLLLPTPRIDFHTPRATHFFYT